MSTSDRSYETLFNTGRELEQKGLTLPDSTPNLSRREREIIQTGQDAEKRK